MNIQLNRSIPLNSESVDVASRLKLWARKYGYTCTDDAPGNWRFRRGSQLEAFYTFDIRKIPTTVAVRISQDRPATIDCSFQVKSWLQLTAPRDPQRAEEQLDLLTAYIQGALSD